jgi:formate dehydrogenase major subunit
MFTNSVLDPITISMNRLPRIPRYVCVLWSIYRGEKLKKIMTRKSKLAEWPLIKQIQRRDPHALGETSASARTRELSPRTRNVDRIVASVCPYCAVGCGQLIYVKDEKIVDIEGDPNSPISAGCLCPKGSATFQLVTSQHREQRVLYRRPYSTFWEPISLDAAMEMVAQRVKKTRDENWQEESGGEIVNRTLSMAHLGGATLDNEENYLIKKLFNSLGILQIENQARI